VHKQLKLLVIDDEPNIRYSIAQVLADDHLAVLEAATADEGLRLAAEYAPDVILLDIRLGKRSGLEVFGELRKIDPKSLVVFITGHGTTDTAIEAMKIGAYDYLVKPLDAHQLQQIVNQALSISRMMHVPALLDEGERPQDRPDLLVGAGPAMQSVCKQIGRVAPQNVNVLVLGDSGTGKELVARALYHHSQRSHAPFLAINCSAIPEALLESELFGHERGAFTGAESRRIGKFEQCNHGTLFLDEVGDMTANTQAKILRLLQEGRFERVGGNETISVDVRVIAATNQNLERLIEEGRFRKDLYYRLRGVTIHLPPLRERREDIPELAHYFLFRYNREIGTAVHSISPAALELLQKYDWPGNVRELQSIIREALIVSAGPTILPEFLPAEVRRGLPVQTDPPQESGDWQELPRLVETWISAGETDLYRRALEHFDRLMIRRAVEHADGNQVRASELLGLSRVTLRAKLRSLGMQVGKVLTE
jgi:two-component system nitrogen regulation response regulator GlnG